MVTINTGLKRRSALLASLGAALALAASGCHDEGPRYELPKTPLPPGVVTEAPAQPATTPPSETAPKQSAAPRPGAPAPQHPAAKTPAPAMGAFASGDVLTGTTRAARTTQIAPRVNAQVRKVLFKEGDVVQKGQILVQLDRTDFILHLKQAQAARNTALAQLAAVKIEWRRLRGLLKAKAIASGQFDKVDSQFKIAQAGIAQANVAILGARTFLAKTTIRAPFRSIVTRKMTEVGVFATMMPPTPLVMLQEIDPIEVQIQVPEAQIEAVKKGTPVRLTFSAIHRSQDARVDRTVASLD
ncbi:MAG: efflux RND transporter periplasmic adaptor subunit, partial [Deltaproteobacteria bacterium]|nr:efflux RND transporter periplasmic adaptor subunit [Deltaproteobacteria bacterium]